MALALHALAAKTTAASPENGTAAESVDASSVEESSTDRLRDAGDGTACSRLTYPVAYTLAFQGIGFAVLNALDPDITGYKSVGVDHFVDGLTQGPAPDDDDWPWNFVFHPLWGSETYLRARSENLSVVQAFLFSTAASVTWEFFFESWVARPSTQDLLLTSTLGSLLGEARFRLLRRQAGRPGKAARRARWLLDPIQSLVESITGYPGTARSEPGRGSVPTTSLNLLPSSRASDERPGMAVVVSVRF